MTFTALLETCAFPLETLPIHLWGLPSLTFFLLRRWGWRLYLFLLRHFLLFLQEKLGWFLQLGLKLLEYGLKCCWGWGNFPKKLGSFQSHLPQKGYQLDNHHFDVVHYKIHMMESRIEPHLRMLECFGVDWVEVALLEKKLRLQG